MLSALHKGKIMYIGKHPTELLKSLSDSKSLFCPDCGENLIFKEYNNRQSHFSHLKSDCTFPFREPESLEHESGKLSLYKWIQSLFGEEHCEVEMKIDLTNQRSDTFIHPIYTAVEFQCSPIHGQTWKTRHELYQSANVKDIWVLGYSMHKRYHADNRFFHKLNTLEEALLQEYGKIIYFDVLTKQFIFLYVEKKGKNYYIGEEFYFKPNEVSIQDGEVTSKYDYFISIQKNRETFLSNQLRQAKYTDDYLQELRNEAILDEKKILASKKQINYIKYLLYQSGKKIPYKLHGLLREEADAIIKKLIEQSEQIQK